MVRSTDAPACAKLPANGGSTAPPIPAPASTIDDGSRGRSDGGYSQKLMLFICGNAISGAPIINGMNQFPNPPIIFGITMKKIMTNVWAVTITL